MINQIKTVLHQHGGLGTIELFRYLRDHTKAGFIPLSGLASKLDMLRRKGIITLENNKWKIKTP